MSNIDFELPEGVTFNGVPNEDSQEEEGSLVKKISCPNCEFGVSAIIIEVFGRYSGKVVLKNGNQIWNGKLASDPEKSKKQILDVFNKKVKDHLDKCQKKD